MPLNLIQTRLEKQCILYIVITCPFSVAGSSTFGWGTTIGLSGVIIPLLRDENTGLAMDDSGVSWFGALLPAGSIVGSFIPGKYLIF